MRRTARGFDGKQNRNSSWHGPESWSSDGRSIFGAGTPTVRTIHRHRVLAFIDQGGYRLVNRHRVDVTDRYPELGFLANLPAGIVLDGEIVVLRQGKPDFGLLLSRNQTRAPLKIRSLARMFPATYVVFDLLYHRFESLL